MPGFQDRNIIGLIQSNYEDSFDGSWARRLSFYNGGSVLEVEKYGIFGGFPKLREWVGARQLKKPNQRQYEIRNREFEGSLAVKERMLSRDQSGLLEAYVRNWVRGVPLRHWEDLLIELINANGLCYDGQNFFDTDHQFAAETAQSNNITASEVTALNIGTTTAPTPEEMAKAILGVVGHMLTFKDDQGRYVNGSARKFVVHVSTVDQFTATQMAISNNLLTGLVDNPLKGMKEGGFMFSVIPTYDLTSATTKFRVYAEDADFPAFVLQQEQDLEYAALGPGSDHYFHHKEWLIGVDASRGAGYGQWMSACQATFS